MIEDSREPAKMLVAFIANAEYESLPSPVAVAVKRSILDTLAVGIAGSAQAGVREGLELTVSTGGTEDATVWVYGDRVPAPQAAFVNGPMARALDMGDVHEEGGHLGEYILPSLLAAAELRGARGQPVSGKELVIAYAVGAEVLSRVGLACRAVTTGYAERKNPQMGSFGACAAVAKLLSADFDTTWNALGIAFSSMGCLESQSAYDVTAR